MLNKGIQSKCDYRMEVVSMAASDSSELAAAVEAAVLIVVVQTGLLGSCVKPL